MAIQALAAGFGLAPQLELGTAEASPGERQMMEAVVRLAKRLAHDLVNVGFIVRGQSELALEELDPASEAFSAIELVLRAGKQVEAIAEELSALSRRGSARLPLAAWTEVLLGMEERLREAVGKEPGAARGSVIAPMRSLPNGPEDRHG